MVSHTTRLVCYAINESNEFETQRQFLSSPPRRVGHASRPAATSRIDPRLTTVPPRCGGSSSSACFPLPALSSRTRVRPSHPLALPRQRVLLALPRRPCTPPLPPFEPVCKASSTKWEAGPWGERGLEAARQPARLQPGSSPTPTAHISRDTHPNQSSTPTCLGRSRWRQWRLLCPRRGGGQL